MPQRGLSAGSWRPTKPSAEMSKPGSPGIGAHTSMRTSSAHPTPQLPAPLSTPSTSDGTFPSLLSPLSNLPPLARPLIVPASTPTAAVAPVNTSVSKDGVSKGEVLPVVFEMGGPFDHVRMLLGTEYELYFKPTEIGSLKALFTYLTSLPFFLGRQVLTGLLCSISCSHIFSRKDHLAVHTRQKYFGGR